MSLRPSAGATPSTVVISVSYSCPYGFGSFTSRAIATGGAAAVQATREIKERLAAAAGVLLERDPTELEFVEGGCARPPITPSR